MDASDTRGAIREKRDVTKSCDPYRVYSQEILWQRDDEIKRGGNREKKGIIVIIS